MTTAILPTHASQGVLLYECKNKDGATMSEELEHRKPRVLPNMAICRAAEMLGIDNFADCLVERPRECSYALAFGYGFLCKHPHRTEIIANTKRFGRARAGDQNIASQE